MRDRQVLGPYFRGFRFPLRRFLLIQRHDYGAGLCSHFITNIGWMKYAEENGFVPIVDMTAADTMYNDLAHPNGNAWERFFEQSHGYCLADIRRAARVYTTVGNSPACYPNDEVSTMTGANLTRWREVVRRHCRPHPEILRDVVQEERCLFADSRRPLGVLLRGTDYVAMRPTGHPVQPDPERALEDVTRRFSEGRFDSVFLVTEDAGIASLFRKRFGNRLKMTGQQPIDYPNAGWICDLKSCRFNLEMAREYLVRIVMLSRCGHIMASRTSGAICAALLSSGYESAFYWDLGRYP